MTDLSPLWKLVESDPAQIGALTGLISVALTELHTLARTDDRAQQSYALVTDRLTNLLRRAGAERPTCGECPEAKALSGGQCICPVSTLVMQAGQFCDYGEADFERHREMAAARAERMARLAAWAANRSHEHAGGA
jgi:hypothetical protein